MSVAISIILFLLSVLAFIGGCSVIGTAKTSIHEIQSFLLFLISAVFLVGFGITAALSELRETMKRTGEPARTAEPLMPWSQVARGVLITTLVVVGLAFARQIYVYLQN